jgi:hypothetical protein
MTLSLTETAVQQRDSGAMRINRELARKLSALKENSRNDDLGTLSRQLSGGQAITPTPAVTDRTHASGPFGIKDFLPNGPW